MSDNMGHQLDESIIPQAEESIIYQSGESIIHQSIELRAKNHFRQAIELIEKNIDTIEPARRASAWWEAFNVACAKGDTELAKKYMLAIDEAKPTTILP